MLLPESRTNYIFGVRTIEFGIVRAYSSGVYLRPLGPVCLRYLRIQARTCVCSMHIYALYGPISREEKTKRRSLTMWKQHEQMVQQIRSLAYFAHKFAVDERRISCKVYVLAVEFFNWMKIDLFGYFLNMWFKTREARKNCDIYFIKILLLFLEVNETKKSNWIKMFG